MAPLLAEGEYQPAQYPKEGGILEVSGRAPPIPLRRLASLRLSLCAKVPAAAPV